MNVEDEFGMIWHVEAGDPAREACLLLGRRGFTWLVLPRELIRGTLKGPRETLTPPRLRATGAMPDNESLARQYRLADCLEVLLNAQV